MEKSTYFTRTLLFPLGLGLIGFGVGWLLPQKFPSEATATEDVRHPRAAHAPVAVDPSLPLLDWGARIDSMNGTELSYLAASLAESSSRHQITRWLPILARWSEVDGPAMIAFIENSPESVRAKLHDLAWFAWGAADPDASFAAGKDLPTATFRELLQGIAETDPRKAATLARQSRHSFFAFADLAARIIEIDPDLGDELLEGAAPNSGRHPFERAKITRLAATDPTAAIAFALSLGNMGSDPVPAAVKAIAERDPLLAVQELEAMPPSRSKALSTVEIAKQWSAIDPDTAVPWIQNLDDGPVRHYALVAAADTIGHQDPERALDLIMEAGKESGGNFFDVRDSDIVPVEFSSHPDSGISATSLLIRLSKTDPAAARRYLNEKVPTHWKAELINATGIEP